MQDPSYNGLKEQVKDSTTIIYETKANDEPLTTMVKESWLDKQRHRTCNGSPQRITLKPLGVDKKAIPLNDSITLAAQPIDGNDLHTALKNIEHIPAEKLPRLS